MIARELVQGVDFCREIINEVAEHQESSPDLDFLGA